MEERTKFHVGWTSTGQHQRGSGGRAERRSVDRQGHA